MSRPRTDETEDVQELERVPGRAMERAQGGVLDLFRQAIDKGYDAASFGKLYELHTQERDHHARISFFDALASFQADCPPVPRNAEVKYPGSSGAEIRYKSADFEIMVTTVGPHLEKHGFALSYDTEVDQAGMMTVIGTLSHRDGHERRASFKLPTANRNPGMSDQQKYAAAATFGKRQVLMAITGLPTTDPDPEDGADPTAITAHQVADLRALIDETKANLTKVLKAANAPTLEEIRAIDFPRIVKAIGDWAREQGQKP